MVLVKLSDMSPVATTFPTTFPEGAGPTEPQPTPPRRDGDRAGPGRAGAHRAVGRFRPDDAEVGRARGLVRSSLTSWGLPGEVACLELAVSELVTNAIVHGHGEIEVCLSATDGVVRLDVVDAGGDEMPQIARPDERDGRGGWGLLVVERMADSWGTEAGPAGTRVWMERAVGVASGPGT